MRYLRPFTSGRYLSAFLFSCLLTLGSAASAQVQIDIDSTVHGNAGNGVLVNLAAGDHTCQFVDGGPFGDAYLKWSSVTGCDMNGANCAQGWTTLVGWNADGGATIFSETPMFWQTSALAIANRSGPFTVTTTGTGVVFHMIDNNLTDNMGGVSIECALVAPSVLEVPTLSGWGLMLLAVVLAFLGVRFAMRS